MGVKSARGYLFALGVLLACLAPPAAEAKGFAVLYHFCSLQNCADGRWPYAGLIQDSQGNLFGTTGAGGITCRLYGCGTVFKLAPDGTETVLHAFSASYDGSGPYGGLVADSAGNLYGTTATGGGTGCGGIDYGCGTVFKITPKGKEKVLYAFGGGNDGAYPLAGLVLDANGNLYGTTENGGGGTACVVQFGGCGTIFKIAPDGTETILYAFSGGSDGANPQAGLILDKKGNLFGTTAYGGSSGANCTSGASPGCGVVFRLAASGKEKTLYAFQGGVSDGDTPVAGLFADKAGNLYGTAEAGGGGSACDPVGCGIVFRVAPDGTETVLHKFAGTNDGAHPAAGLIADRNANLYGTTYSGGSQDAGTVFKLAPDGTLTVLNDFSGGTNGQAPVAGLLAGSNGVRYGTTEFGSDGIVFKVGK